MGDIPLSPSSPMGEATGVWLTNSPQRTAQKWAGRRGNGPMGLYLVDKTAIRLTVEIPDSHLDRLHLWRDYADRHGVEPFWRERLERVGGGAQQADGWHIYDGIVLRPWILKVEDLKPQTYSAAHQKLFTELHRQSRALLQVKAAPDLRVKAAPEDLGRATAQGKE